MCRYEAPSHNWKVIDAPLANPPTGWAVAGPTRPRRTPRPGRARRTFWAGLVLLNACFGAALGLALAGPGEHDTRVVVVAIIFWGGVTANIAYLTASWLVRKIARSRRFIQRRQALT